MKKILKLSCYLWGYFCLNSLTCEYYLSFKDVRAYYLGGSVFSVDS